MHIDTDHYPTLAKISELYPQLTKGQKQLADYILKNPSEVVNKSINQSLARSINTTVSTVIAVGTVCVICYIFHVESILIFTLPMMIGMLAGAYSSVCIAGPLWVTWQDRKAAKKKLQK